MTLTTFLAGRPAPRPNPVGRWRVERRHAEGGTWDLLLEDDEAVVRDELLAPRALLGVGDLVRLFAPAGAAAGLWVVAPGGLVEAGPVPDEVAPEEFGWRTADWFDAWEGPYAEPSKMVLLVDDVDRRRLVLLACDCAERALGVLPPGEGRPAALVAAARRWATDGGGVEGLEDLNDAAFDVIYPAGSGRVPAAVREAAFSAIHAAGVVTSTDAPGMGPGHDVSSALDKACAALHPVGFDRADPVQRAQRRTFAAVVRRWVPLPVLLLARAGVPTPLALVL